MCQVFVAIRSRFPARRVGEDAFVPKHRAKAKPVAVHGPLACAERVGVIGSLSTLKAGRMRTMVIVLERAWGAV